MLHIYKYKFLASGWEFKIDHIRSIGRSMFLNFRIFWNIAWNIYIYIYIQKSICSKCWDHFPRGCCNGPANCCIYGFSPGYALSELGWFVGFTGLFYFFLTTPFCMSTSWKHWREALGVGTIGKWCWKSRNLRHWLARGLDAPPPYPAWSQTSFWSILWMVFFPSTTDLCWDGATVLVLHFITGGANQHMAPTVLVGLFLVTFGMTIIARWRFQPM